MIASHLHDHPPTAPAARPADHLVNPFADHRSVAS